MLLQQENEALLEDVTSRQVHQNPPGEPHDGPREAEEPAGEEVQVMLSSSRRPPVFFFSFCRRCHSPIHRLDWLGDLTLTSRPRTARTPARAPARNSQSSFRAKEGVQQARPEIGGPRAEQRREVGAPGRPALLDTPHGEVLRARRAPRFSPTSHRRSQIPANTTTSDTDHTVRRSELVISSAAASTRIGHQATTPIGHHSKDRTAPPACPPTSPHACRKTKLK